MNAMNAALDAAIRAVCPIYGVCIGDPADKSTWLVNYTAAATAQQRTNAQAVINAFTYTTPDPADLDQMEKAMKALGLLLRQYANQLRAGTYTNKSVADLKADFKTLWDSLV